LRRPRSDQPHLVAATLAEGRGVLLAEACATCDRDLRAVGSVVCPVCGLSRCAEICWDQHVDSDARCTRQAMRVAVARARHESDARLARVAMWRQRALPPQTADD
jgi:uncharacterized Zn finger protein (UPF0148 family)